MFSSAMRKCPHGDRRNSWPTLISCAWALMVAVTPVYSQAVIATIPLNLPPTSLPLAVAVNTVTNKIYVVANSGSLTVIDGASKTTLSVPIPGGSPLIAVNETANKIYIVEFSSITVVDGATDAPVANIDVPFPSGTFDFFLLNGVAVNPVTNKIYVTLEGVNPPRSSILVIDGETNAIISQIGVEKPFSVAVNPVTNKIYVQGGSIAVIDGATNAASFLTDPNAGFLGQVIVNSATNRIYVANLTSNNITAIDGATNSLMTVAAPVAAAPVLGIPPRSVLAVNSMSNRIYALSSGMISIIDGATNLFTTLSTNSSDAGSVAVDSVTNRIYWANFSEGTVGVMDGATNSIVNISDPNALSPLAVAVNPVTDRIYVINQSSNNVTVIDGGAPTPPSCQISQIVTGPPKQLMVAMQDTGSGLNSISLVDSVNASVSIPVFSPGTTSQVLVTATKVDQTQSSDVAFQVTNMAGLTTSCDPVDFTVTLDGLRERHVFRSVNPKEHYIQIKNGTPGVRQMTLSVNGHAFQVPALQDGETYSLDIGWAMQTTMAASMAKEEMAGRPVPGRSRGQAVNNVVMYASGQRGSSAYILIGDASVQTAH